MPDETRDVFFELLKSSSKYAVKKGVTKLEIPDSVASGLADQLSVTFDLVKKGGNITPGYLGIMLATKGVGIAKIAGGKKFECGTAVVTLGIAVTKAACFTTWSGPAYALVKAISILSDLYSVDKACGVTDAVAEKVHEVVDPAYIWLERGIWEWMSRGGP
jgi:hypothetical protein